MTTDSIELPELPPKGYGNDGHSDEAMRSYALLAVQKERERCAKVCEEMGAYCGGHGEPPMPRPRDYAAAIRKA